MSIANVQGVDHLKVGPQFVYFFVGDTDPSTSHAAEFSGWSTVLSSGATSPDGCAIDASPTSPPSVSDPSIKAPPTQPPAPPLGPPPPRPPQAPLLPASPPSTPPLNLTVGGLATVQRLPYDPDNQTNQTDPTDPTDPVDPDDPDATLGAWAYEVEIRENRKSRVYFESGYLYEPMDWVVFVPMIFTQENPGAECSIASSLSTTGIDESPTDYNNADHGGYILADSQGRLYVDVVLHNKARQSDEPLFDPDPDLTRSANYRTCLAKNGQPAPTSPFPKPQGLSLIHI